MAKHDVWISWAYTSTPQLYPPKAPFTTRPWWEDKEPKTYPLSVTLVNDEDGEYAQEFETGAELDAFIAKLQQARRDAFGEPTAEEKALAHGMPKPPPGDPQ